MADMASSLYLVGGNDSYIVRIEQTALESLSIIYSRVQSNRKCNQPRQKKSQVQAYLSSVVRIRIHHSALGNEFERVLLPCAFSRQLFDRWTGGNHFPMDEYRQNHGHDMSLQKPRSRPLPLTSGCPYNSWTRSSDYTSNM